jgi:hypothetical protein
MVPVDQNVAPATLGVEMNDNYYLVRRVPTGDLGPLPGPSWLYGAAAGAALFFFVLKKRRK